MPPVKTKVLTPEPSPTGAGPATPGPEIPTSQPKSETDMGSAIVHEKPLPIAVGPPVTASEATIPEVAPNRPGLETPPTPELAPTPDPFTLLVKWHGNNTHRSLRAIEIPGLGCIVRVSAAIPGQLSESVCFVPGTTIKDGFLAKL